MKIFFKLFLLLFFANNIILAKPTIVDSSYSYEILKTNITYPSGLTEKKGDLLISDLTILFLVATGHRCLISSSFNKYRSIS